MSSYLGFVCALPASSWNSKAQAGASGVVLGRSASTSKLSGENFLALPSLLVLQRGQMTPLDVYLHGLRGHI